MRPENEPSAAVKEAWKKRRKIVFTCLLPGMLVPHLLRFQLNFHLFREAFTITHHPFLQGPLLPLFREPYSSTWCYPSPLSLYSYWCDVFGWMTMSYIRLEVSQGQGLISQSLGSSKLAYFLAHFRCSAMVC